ncbi:MAG TPA: L-threonylcarbamoyladenylate synthase [Kiloniellales bacterium]|nr:L-threonylcarbamoyladenylate synthase [Kiloniellales bacterium]
MHTTRSCPNRDGSWCRLAQGKLAKQMAGFLYSPSALHSGLMTRPQTVSRETARSAAGRSGAPEIRAPDAETYRQAAAILRAGGLVAFPTETVYGLGADATNDRAVAEIFAAKGRPRFNPLIVHFPDAGTAAREVEFDARAEALAARFWPGPLTLVLPRRAKSRISLVCSAGLSSLAVRMPDHPVGQALLRAVDRPLAAPSANRSGALSPTTAAHVAASLGPAVPLILDGGPCRVGLESTVLALTGATPRLLRPGGVPREALEALVGPLLEEETNGDDAAPESPGRLASHYAPERPLRLAAREVGSDEALLAFGPEPLAGAAVTINLSQAGDTTEAAARLFAALHDLDRPLVRAIAVMPIPETGLGLAINDRLRRAAAPRPAPDRETRDAG